MSKVGVKMSEKIEDFVEALLRVYRQEPCGVLANAFWKTRRQVDEFETEFSVVNGGVEQLKMWAEDNLHIIWDKDGRFDLSDEFMEEAKFMLVHEKYLDDVPLDSFSNKMSYFRMKHDHEDIPESTLPEGFRFKDVDTHKEAGEVSELIGKCYDNLKPNKEEVEGWTEHCVFDEKLWVWICDEDGNYAGLGIAEIDKTVPEASLEWIQVLPEYHGYGLGKALVYELLNRVDDRVKFTTVGGEYDSDENPKGFYESCGFHGNDIWWVLRE